MQPFLEHSELCKNAPNFKEMMQKVSKYNRLCKICVERDTIFWDKLWVMHKTAGSRYFAIAEMIFKSLFKYFSFFINLMHIQLALTFIDG